jgi:hypothetical protein
MQCTGSAFRRDGKIGLRASLSVYCAAVLQVSVDLLARPGSAARSYALRFRFCGLTRPNRIASCLPLPWSMSTAQPSVSHGITRTLAGRLLNVSSGRSGMASIYGGFTGRLGRAKIQQP